MPLQFTGTLKIVQKGREFTDKQTGHVTPPKFTNFIAYQDDNGDPKVAQLKSKVDYSQFVDDIVDCTVMLYEMSESSGFWANITHMEEAVIN